MTTDDSVKLIELAYAASMVLLISQSERKWDAPVGDIMPAEIERECYRLATELGLNPPDRVEILEKLQARWRRQLRQQWQREMLDIGMLLVRQHGLISFLQCHPTSPTRPELCFILDQIRADLTRLLKRYKLTESLSKLPELPLPGAPESWMTWSGDELRASVLKELGAPEE